MTICGTVSGRRVDLVAPDWRDIDLGDIARGLSQINRFAGQTRRPISVAEHSLVVRKLCAAGLRLAGLLHDGHEAYFGDWPTPAVQAVGREIKGALLDEAVHRVKFRLDVAIARRVLEDVGAAAPQPLADEAVDLARQMRFGSVCDADFEAFGLENDVRGYDALRGRAGALALAHYPVVAPDANVLMAEWLAAVRAAARARYGAAP